MAKCSSQKRGYLTESMAEDALIEARTRFIHNAAVGFYLCEECGDWHLTSHGDLNARLKKMLEDGTLSKDREAEDWERKFRN